MRSAYFYFLLSLTTPFQNLTAMPQEKRVQMCFVMQEALEPKTSSWWHIGKISTSSLVGLGAALAISYINPTEKKVSVKDERLNRLVKVHNAISQARTKLIPETETPHTFTIPEIPSSPSLLQGATFLITGIATYLLLTILADKIGKSHLTTLREFLADWPDYAFYAPQKLRDEAGSLYGAYLREGDIVLGDERTAELILQAFSIFLSEEVQAISVALQ